MVRVHVLTTPEEFTTACEQLLAGHGPLAIDAERASGFTYSQRAYLIQFHRRGAGTLLLDAPAIGDFSQLSSLFTEEEWILHAASQDLPCLREVGILPQKIFDTELSARLLGMERVGLGAVVEELLGVHLEKAHSAADWSTRPLPDDWLSYAALDVEHLVDVRDELFRRLSESGKLEWAQQEFAAILSKPDKPVSLEPWRRLSGLHTIKNPQQLAIARSLWEARDQLAQDKDVSPGRLIPDSSLIWLAQSKISTQGQLAGSKEFSGRASRSHINLWWNAYQTGITSTDLPATRVPTESIPAPRLWSDKRPEAFERLTLAKEAIASLAEENSMPVENLLTPSILRELCWNPPAEITVVTVSEALEKYGARSWQISLCCVPICNAFVEAHQISSNVDDNNS